MSAKNLFTRKLSIKEFDILKKVKVDPFFFASFIFVIHPLFGRTRFDLYPYQRRVLWEFLNNRFNIILKFRQAGITELISMYALWLAMYHPYKNIVIISIKDRVAKKVLRKIKYMYRNLPDYLKQPVVNGRGEDVGTATELEFANGSMITSIPTTEEAGRSDAVSLLIIDEAAIVRWISKIWAAAFPTLSTGGAAIVNSTPYGVGNWYHKKWVEACAKGSDFCPIRLKWQMHPERDDKWYTTMSQELGPRKTAQEIDGDFLTSGNSVFDLVEIKAIEDMLNEPEYIPKQLEENGKLRIYRFPEKNEQCFIGADIASGRANDYSAFSVMNKAGEELASFKGKIGIFPFADLLMKTGKRFNNALLGPEANDIGLGVVSRIQEAGYSNLHYIEALVKKKGHRKPEKKQYPGWYTTKSNRPIIIAELEEDLRNDENLIIKDPEFVREAYTFIYDSNNKPTAMGGSSSQDMESDLEDSVFNDDSILAKAITNRLRKTKVRKNVILPR